jgi:hypothetical protein
MVNLYMFETYKIGVMMDVLKNSIWKIISECY